jgi:hypothetical protein
MYSTVDANQALPQDVSHLERLGLFRKNGIVSWVGLVRKVGLVRSFSILANFQEYMHNIVYFSPGKNKTSVLVALQNYSSFIGVCLEKGAPT